MRRMRNLRGPLLGEAYVQYAVPALVARYVPGPWVWPGIQSSREADRPQDVDRQSITSTIISCTGAGQTTDMVRISLTRS